MSINSREYQLWDLIEICSDVVENLEKDLSEGNINNEYTKDQITKLYDCIATLYPQS